MAEKILSSLVQETDMRLTQENTVLEQLIDESMPEQSDDVILVQLDEAVTKSQEKGRKATHNCCDDSDTTLIGVVVDLFKTVHGIAVGSLSGCPAASRIVWIKPPGAHISVMSFLSSAMG